jgi:hypothetical protein
MTAKLARWSTDCIGSAICPPRPAFAQRKPGLAARFSSPAWGRRRHLPEGNSCLHCGCHLGGWGNRVASQRRDYASAMAAAQREASHASHAKRGKIFVPFTQCLGEQQASFRAANGLEIPALRIGDEKIAERLYARNRLQLLGIDEIRVERLCFGFAEKLHKPAILLDQVIRQHGDA